MANEDSGKSNSEKLDLGLSSLLEGAGAELKATLNQPGSLSEVLKKSVELSQAASQPEVKKNDPDTSVESPAEKNEFVEFSENGKWAELSKFCEEKLSKSNDTDKSAKLWWIKSQYETKSIPVSILAPGLNLIVSEILKPENLSKTEARICQDMLIKFSSNLIENNDYELSLLFLGYLLESNFSNSSEISRIVSETESKLNRESKFQDNAQLLKDLEALKSKHKLKIYNNVFDKIEITEQTFIKKEPLNKEKALKTRSPRRKFAFAAAAAFVLLLTFYFSGAAGKFYTGLSNFIQTALAGTGGKSGFKPGLEFVADYSEHDLIAPQPERVAGLNQIDAVFYEVSNTAEKPQAVVQPAAVRPASVQQSSAPNSPLAKLPNRTEQELSEVGKSGGKEKVNTSYPLESQNKPSANEQPDAQENIPEIDFPPYRSNSSKGSGGNGYAADRKPAKNEPNFIVIARTRVMKEPTYWADATADLAVGDRVLVEEQIGKWLRIRAKNGNIGYILAQDADRIL